MATKSPLLRVSGKIGLFLGRKNVPITGTGALSKSHGHYVLKAAVTATQARHAVDMEAMKKKHQIILDEKKQSQERMAELEAKQPKEKKNDGGFDFDFGAPV